MLDRRPAEAEAETPGFNMPRLTCEGSLEWVSGRLALQLGVHVSEVNDF